MAEGKFIISAQNRIKEGLDAAQKDLETFGGNSDSIGKKIRDSFVVTFGDIQNIVKGAFATVSEFVNAYAGAEQSLNTLKAALDISPKADLSSLEKLTSFASDLQALTGIEDDATIKLEAMLISMGRTAEETTDIIKLAADYSAATGKSFETSVEQINKTFGGTARELGQLFPELKDLTKEELASGSAVDILKEKFGGFSEQLADSASVSIDKFNASVGDMKEALGEAIMPAVQPFLEWLVKFLNDPVIPLIQGLAPIVEKTITTISNIVSELKIILEPIVTWIGDVFGTVLVGYFNYFVEQFKALVALLVAIFKGDWATAWESAKNIVGNSFELIQKMFKPVTDAASKIWDGIKTTWSNAWEGLKNAVKKPIDSIISYFDPIIDAVNKVINGIQTAVQFVSGEKRVGNMLVDKNNKIVGEYIVQNGVEVLKRYAMGTAGAEPGLALVGEKGPELVLFKGGEQVIPNHLLPDNIGGIRGYANGTEEWVNFTVKNILGNIQKIGDDVNSVGNLAGVLTGFLNSIIGSLGIFGNIIMGMNPVLAMLEPVLQGFVQIIGPAFTAVIQPVMNVLMQFGQLIAQALLPIFDALLPILSLVALHMQTLLAPAITVVATVAEWVAARLDMLNPILVLIAKAFTILMAPVEFVADLFNWVGGVISAFGTNVGVAMWNITHPFSQRGFVSGPGAFSSDAFSGLADRLAAIDELAANTGAISSSVSTTTASQSASYRVQPITINIYQQAPVVGSDGMREFARMIRGEFDALGYLGA